MSLRWCMCVLVVCLMQVTAFATADTSDIAYGDDPKQQLDVFTVDEASEAVAKASHPVVIWVHGGGWRNGDKDNHGGAELCKTWASAGIVTVNLNYRLTPDVVHPAHVQDVAAGIAWVHKNIAKYGGDPKRVFLLGHSAGAHLVALVATDPQYLKLHGLTPKADIAGVMPIDTASYDLNETGTRLVRKMIHDAFGDDPKVLADASPLNHAKKNPDACPPFVIAVVKQRDEAFIESMILNKALLKSTMIPMDYPGMHQLKAHAQIAADLSDLNNSMTKQLIEFVNP